MTSSTHSNKLGIAVIGMGFMGQAFAQICTQLSDTSDVESILTKKER